MRNMTMTVLHTCRNEAHTHTQSALCAINDTLHDTHPEEDACRIISDATNAVMLSPIRP